MDTYLLLTNVLLCGTLNMKGELNADNRLQLSESNQTLKGISLSQTFIPIKKCDVQEGLGL